MKKILTYLLIGLAVACLLAGCLLAGLAVVMNKSTGQIVSAGENRKYLLYVPDSYDPAKPTPLVITFHGFIEWPEHIMRMSHWNKLADEYGFIVVYPRGTGIPLRWRAYGFWAGGADSQADVTFISDLIDKLESQYNIDPSRIYANGMSNGGGMTFALSCKLSERFAAIGLVAGAYSLPWSACGSTRLLPAIIFHGDADRIVPYLGGQTGALHKLPSIPQWVKTMTGRNGCDDEPVRLPDQGEASGIRYTNCSNNAGVDFYTIAGGGHTWPGGEPIMKFLTGHTTQDIDATRVMWEFFQAHPMSE